MKQAKRKKLETIGWKVGTTAEFLGLTPEEQTFIEMKLSLGSSLKDLARAIASKSKAVRTPR